MCVHICLCVCLCACVCACPTLAIRSHSPAKPVLIFVSSRRQTRLTALDLIAYLATEDDPKQWLHQDEKEVCPTHTTPDTHTYTQPPGSTIKKLNSASTVYFIANRTILALNSYNGNGPFFPDCQ